MGPRAPSRLARGAALDLGGIAKGALADLLIDELGDDASATSVATSRVRGWAEVTAGISGSAIGRRSRCAMAPCAPARTTRPAVGPVDASLDCDPRPGMPVKTDLAEVSVITTSRCAARSMRNARCCSGVRGRHLLESRGVGHAVVPAAGRRRSASGCA